MEDDLNVIDLDEKEIASMVYEIRGQKVMLDFDLARIYGYETRDFNNQIKHNSERFDEDFVFQITKSERDQLLRLKKSTANKLSSKRRYNPYAFTEQGIYMLMTVLKGDLAVKQSKALIRLFKRMKDYLIENHNYLSGDTIQLVNLVNDNTKRIDVLESKIDKVMENFTEGASRKHFLLFDNQRLEADLVYQQIYSLAKTNLIIIDDYLDIKTLQLLRACSQNVTITIFSDNKAKKNLTKQLVDDFIKDNESVLLLKKNNQLVHDRYIFVDYDKEGERLFHSGGSSKDGGKRISSIMEIDQTKLYHPLIERLFSNDELML